MKKRIITIALALVMCLSIIPTTVQAATFSDVPATHWAYDAIDYITNNSIMAGYPGGTFEPNLLINRAEMAAVMCRAMNVNTPTSTPSSLIAANNPSAWYYNSVNHAVAEGWMVVDNNGYFHPNEKLTRQEISLAIAFLVNIFNPLNDFSSYANSYTDVGSIGSGYVSAVGFLTYYGIIAGYTDGTFRPGGDITRAEVAFLLHRVLTEPLITFDVAQTSWNPPATAESATIAITSDISWTAASDKAWLTVSPSSGTNNGTLTLAVTANTGAARTGAVTVKMVAGTPERIIVVTQAAGGGGSSSGGGAPKPENPDAGFTGGSSYVLGSGKGIVYTVQKEAAQLANVKVGNTALVKDKDYKIEGSTTAIITLLPAYLDTLPAGKHAITVSFKDNTSATGEFTIEAYKNPFTDVEDAAWYFDAVKYVFGKELMIGTAGDKFSPESTLTRAMIVTILYRHAGEPDVSSLENPFSDVPGDIWYTDAVKWAYKNEIVTGYGYGKFGPNDPVTKEQLAALIYRTQQSSGKIPLDILMDYEHPDWDKISDWAKSAVNKLTMQGIFRDIPGVDFNPRNPATRAEIASMLYRWLTAIEA